MTVFSPRFAGRATPDWRGTRQSRPPRKAGRAGARTAATGAAGSFERYLLTGESRGPDNPVRVLMAQCLLVRPAK